MNTKNKIIAFAVAGVALFASGPLHEEYIEYQNEKDRILSEKLNRKGRIMAAENQRNFEEQKRIEREKFVADSIEMRQAFVADSLRQDSTMKANAADTLLIEQVSEEYESDIKTETPAVIKSKKLEL